MAGDAIRAGAAFVEGVFDDKKMLAGLTGAQRKIAAVANSVKKVSATIAAGGAALLAPLTAAVASFAAAGSALADMSARTGLSVEKLSGLTFAAEQTGAGMEQLEAGIRSMQRMLLNAERGSAAAVETLAALGLTLDQLRGQGPEAQFELLAARLNAIPDASQRAALAMQALGKSGQQLLPMIGDLDALTARARELGLVMTTEDANAADALGDAWDELKGSGAALANTIGAALAPSITAIVERLVEVAKQAVAWIDNNRELVVQGTALVAGLTAMAAVVGTCATAIGALNVAMTFLVANPVGAALVALTAVVVGLGVAIAAIDADWGKLNKTMAETLAKGDQLRAQDQGRIAELQALAAKGRLSNQEMARAAELISDLEGSFGDLGLGVNQTTGAIEGLTSAIEQMNAAFRQQQIDQLDQALEEHKANLKRLRGQMDDFSFKHGLLGQDEAVAELDAKIVAEMQAARELHKRIDRLQGSDQAAASPPIAAPAPVTTVEVAPNPITDPRLEPARPGGGSPLLRPIDTTPEFFDERARLEDQATRARIEAQMEGLAKDKALNDLDRQIQERELKRRGLWTDELASLLDQEHAARALGLEKAAAVAEVAGPENAQENFSGVSGTFEGELAHLIFGAENDVPKQQLEVQRSMLSEQKKTNEKLDGAAGGIVLI